MKENKGEYGILDLGYGERYGIRKREFQLFRRAEFLPLSAENGKTLASPGSTTYRSFRPHSPKF
jgi:hypothetical protein